MTMGTKVMVRATRSFNGRVENEWYHVDPDDPSVRALIAGGYYAHQEVLPWNEPEVRRERLKELYKPIEPLPPDPEFAAKVKRKARRVEVEAEPGPDPAHSPG